MKKIFGYGIFCLFSFLFMYCLSLRIESLEDNSVVSSNKMFTIQNNA